MFMISFCRWRGCVGSSPSFELKISRGLGPFLKLQGRHEVGPPLEREGGVGIVISWS